MNGFNEFAKVYCAKHKVVSRLSAGQCENLLTAFVAENTGLEADVDLIAVKTCLMGKTNTSAINQGLERAGVIPEGTKRENKASILADLLKA